MPERFAALSGPMFDLLRRRPRRFALAVALLALAATATVLWTALARGARAQAFRVAITVGEGHLTLLPDPGRGGVTAVIADPGPIYTQPALMRSDAVVAPRFTVPVEAAGPSRTPELAVLHGLELDSDPQARLLAPFYAEGRPPARGEGAAPLEVALGADLATVLGARLGATVALRMDAPETLPVRATVVGLIRTGREEWDAHGLWSALPLARAVSGLPRPRGSDAATHLAVFLDDPESSGVWKSRIERMTLPDLTTVKEWWQLDLTPLRYAPEAESATRWPITVLVLLAAGIAANLLLGPAGLRATPGRLLPSEGELRQRILATIAVQALFVAAAALAAGAVLVLAARVLLPLTGTGPVHAQAFLSPAALLLGRLLPQSIVPSWSLGETVATGVVLLVCAALASAVRLWRIEALPDDAADLEPR